jgi:L-lactate dehydrogenase complex protein LldF
MSDVFHVHIQAALADPGLQAALDLNAERRLNARLQAYTSLPEDVLTLRKRAHAVRAETITHLELYLDQFVAQAQANGLVVHRANDAAQAVEIVKEIARQHGARLIAKAKTMVGEEIQLNQALEAVGLTAVETDLGEYIVQLRGEHPAHILTPAVHLRRSDVGQTFHEKLGVPYTDDVASLVSIARQNLRQTFLDADIGVSGVNFGVVEDGSLCLLSNEGNARLVTTVPPVHVALMGIERLVPTLDNLALMLSLLARSGTGQKMTVYTSLIRSPRRLSEPDGPQERHLVLVDNGRNAVRSSTLAESLYCIRCGACLNACPVFREIGGHAYVGIHGQGSPYSGPIGSVISPGLFGGSEFGGLARASTLCGACKDACPVDIDLPELLLRVRAGAGRPQPGAISAEVASQAPKSLQWGLRLYAWAAADERRFAFAQRLAGFFGRLAAPFSGWMHLPAWSGWGLSRNFPRPASRPFRARFQTLDKPPALGDSSHKNVILSEAKDPDSSVAALPQNDIVRMDVTAQNDKLREDAPSSKLNLVERFASELTALGGVIHTCTSAELKEHLLTFLRERGISSVMSWEMQELPDGMVQALIDAGIKVSHVADPTAQAGLTGTLAAVADTGTLVIPSGNGRLQVASLLAGIHIAILYSRNVYENLPQVLQLREVKDASVVSLISGPSRTADIELSLTIGMHGPAEVHVFCLD